MFRVFLNLWGLVFLAALIPAPLPAATEPVPEEIRKILVSFFDLLKQNKLDEAYDVVLADTGIKGREDEVKSLKKQTRDAIDMYGPIIGFEIVDQKRAGMNLLRIVCLSRSDKYPLRWRFTYYRPRDRWKLLDIFVDDRVADLLEPEDHATTPGGAPRSRD